MKNACDGLISRGDPAKERISELKAMSIKTSQTEKQREKRKGGGVGGREEKEQKVKHCETVTKGITYVSWEHQKEKEEKKEQKKFWK